MFWFEVLSWHFPVATEENRRNLQPGEQDINIDRDSSSWITCRCVGLYHILFSHILFFFLLFVHRTVILLPVPQQQSERDCRLCFLIWGGVRLSPFGKPAAIWPVAFVPAPDDIWRRVWSSWWNDGCQEKPKHSEKPAPALLCSPIIPCDLTWVRSRAAGD
jgi:hypothetical protein